MSENECCGSIICKSGNSGSIYSEEIETQSIENTDNKMRTLGTIFFAPVAYVHEQFRDMTGMYNIRNINVTPSRGPCELTL